MRGAKIEQNPIFPFNRVNFKKRRKLDMLRAIGVLPDESLLTSRWMEAWELVTKLEIGDLVEFDRGAFKVRDCLYLLG